MTTYINLPVYKTSYDLLLKIFGLVKNFTREYKYTLGDKIKNEIVDMISNVYKANSSFEKRVYNIKKAREQVEVLRLYIRLSYDLKVINKKNHIDLNKNIESMSKQLYLWEKSFKSNHR